jgi:hypothetical protein
MAWISTEVEVDLEDFSDEDLIEELRERNYDVESIRDLREGSDDGPIIQDLYAAWVYKIGNFEDLFRKYCQQNIGKSF